MYRYNFSMDSEYHTQRNNKLVPFKACNTTSAVMALKQANIAFTVPDGLQEEDYLTSILQTPEAYDVMRKLAPWAFDAKTGQPIYPPQQVHCMLEWGINRMVGRTVDVFQTNLSLRQMVFELVKGSGIVLSGSFDLPDGRELGHIVSLAGVETDQSDLDQITTAMDVSLRDIAAYIIDDPYGNWTTSYDSHRGNNIGMSTEIFNLTFRKAGDINNKFAHVIKER